MVVVPSRLWLPLFHPWVSGAVLAQGPQTKCYKLASQPAVLEIQALHSVQESRCGSANSLCLLARFYIQNVPTRRHNRPNIHTTTLHPTTLHSHLPPDHTPAPHSHLYFGYKLHAGAYRWASSQCSLRTGNPSTSTETTTLKLANTQPTHPLATYTYEPWLYSPPPLTKERSTVGHAQAPHILTSCWLPPSIHSSNGLGCIVYTVFLTWYLWHIKVWWQYPHGGRVQHPGMPPYPSCSVYVLCLFS